jgi:hypothetical protein
MQCLHERGIASALASPERGRMKNQNKPVISTGGFYVTSE